MKVFIGTIQAFAFDFVPSGWAQCYGQLLPISQNTALFALLGTYFGGNGTTTFALPNLQGRVPLGMGTSPSGNFAFGQSAGAATATLTLANLPSHSHSIAAPVNTSPGNVATPQDSFLAAAPFTGGGHVPVVSSYAAAATPNQTAGVFPSGFTGSGQAFSIEPPYLSLNYCIALVGLFPTRS